MLRHGHSGAVVENILTYCAVCEQWWAHESNHGCQMAPDYRASRNADRAEKITQLRAAGIAIADERCLL